LCSIFIGDAAMKGIYVPAFAVFVTIFFAAFADGNQNRGERVFSACAACHSLQPDQNMTGPSLAGVWNRKAGSLASFSRYSSALQSSSVVWNDNTLDEWIANPQHLIPGNRMTFGGIEDPRQRADLLAFLRKATQPGASVAQGQMGGMGMGGMMGGGQVADLKKLGPKDRVQGVTYCKDTYIVTTGDGKSRKFWERNLRLMTDASGRGPNKNAPIIQGAGMLGDRADVIFAGPQEISGFIKPQC
jgi:cytochrome c